MQDHTVQLPWGAQEIRLALPKTWHVAGVLEPSPLPAVPDPAAETARALQTPYESPRLSDLARPGQKIALIIDDGSRPTPQVAILPSVIAELERGGASRAQITLVTALGVHRAMTEEEVARRVGPELLSTLKWENHVCDDPEKLVHLGVTSRSTPVYINKTVAEADLVVAVGCIEPHLIASYGGGLKNIVPGVAGAETIGRNHILNARPDTFNMVGQPIDKNPMRLDLEEAAGMLRGKIFIVNAVLNSALEVVQVVCGAPIPAHRAGAAISARVYGVKIPALADVVITGSHPMDIDMRQGLKALANTVRALKPGGTMLTFVRANEGVGVFALAEKGLPLGKRALKTVAPVLLPMVPRLKLKGLGEEDKLFLYFALQVMMRTHTYLYAPNIPEPVHKNMPFVTFLPSPEAMLQAAVTRYPEKAEVLIFPHGGMTYPILPDGRG